VKDLAPGAIAPAGEAALPPALEQEFLCRARQRCGRKGEMVIARGSNATEVFLIRTGRVQAILYSGSGREVILREIGPGHIFGGMATLDGRERCASAVVSEAGQLAWMSGPRFREFLGEVPGAGLWMASQLATRIRNLSDKVLELTTLPVAGRVQAELLRLAAPHPVVDDQVRISPLPTHAELAARIGSHREAVSRELGQLAREGLLRQSGRSLAILSFSRLQALHARFSR